MKSFHNKVAVITGAVSGIGEAIARECAHKNMKIVLADINSDKLLKLEKKLNSLNNNTISVVTDVSAIPAKQRKAERKRVLEDNRKYFS